MDFQLKVGVRVDFRQSKTLVQKAWIVGHDQNECSRVSTGCWHRGHGITVLDHLETSAPLHIPLLLRSHIKDWCLGIMAGLDMRRHNCLGFMEGSMVEW